MLTSSLPEQDTVRPASPRGPDRVNVIVISPPESVEYGKNLNGSRMSCEVFRVNHHLPLDALHYPWEKTYEWQESQNIVSGGLECMG